MIKTIIDGVIKVLTFTLTEVIPFASVIINMFKKSKNKKDENK